MPRYCLVLLLTFVFLGCDSGFVAKSTNKKKSEPAPAPVEEAPETEVEPPAEEPQNAPVDPPVFELAPPTFESAFADTLTLSWIAASDAEELSSQYRVCLLPANTQIASIEAVNSACAASWLNDWDDSLSLDLSGLDPALSYLAVVVAKNNLDDRVVYASTEVRTTSNVVASETTALSTKLSWTAVSPELASTKVIKHRVCRSELDNVATVSDMGSNCEWQTRWARNLTEMTVYGLLPERTYHFNIEVKGINDSTSSYVAVSVTTAAAPSNTYYVDDAFTITDDTGGVGLTAGDTVTFADGEFAQAGGLIFATNAFTSVDDAVAAANTSALPATIILGQGEFVANASLAPTVNTSFVGSSRNNTILKHNYDGSGGNLISFAAGLVGNVANLTIDGANFNLRYGIDCRDSQVVAANINYLNIVTPGYAGSGLLSYGSLTEVTVLNSYFENIGRIGFFVYASGPVNLFRWNEYKAKGAGDHIDYVVQVSNTVGAVLSENLVYDNYGVASSDGSSGAFIGAFGTDVDNNSVTISYNEIRDSSYGLHFGYSSGTTDNELGDYQVFGNLFTNVTSGVEAVTLATVVDLSNNWWGDASGPYHATLNPDGTGSILGNGVTFDPWLQNPE